MPYMIDPGYRQRKIVFETEDEAILFTNFMRKHAGVDWEVKEIDKPATHVYPVDIVVKNPKLTKAEAITELAFTDYYSTVAGKFIENAVNNSLSDNGKPFETIFELDQHIRENYI